MTGLPLAERLEPAPEPMDVYRRVAHLPLPIFLDSAARGLRGRYSFVAADPVATFSSRGKLAERRDRAGGLRRLESDAVTAAASEVAAVGVGEIPGLPPFQGGAAGYIGYEWGATIEPVARAGCDDLDLPDVLLGLYSWLIAWDHQEDAAWIIATGLGGSDPTACIASVRQRLAQPPQSAPPRRTIPVRSSCATVPFDAFRPVAVRSTFTRDQYISAVARVREYIFAGDVFQVNISQRFELGIDASAVDLYDRLRTRHPAAFGALIEADGFAVLSASPERFLRLRDDAVETCPIKGTRPRGATPDEDAALALELIGSEKDRAENVMIVDLLRNDLSRTCRPGSVRVTGLCAVESYPTVHHLVSTVTGLLAETAGAAELIRGAFPGGSITGAPKVRAMEIIAELEPTRRGVYCGAIGYLSVTGACDLSIAIRTAVVRGETAYISAGGGVTASSDPAAEYEETLAKARGIVAALGAR